ncbi:fibronectin type III domain-containing protein [Iocasia frigidifontis]|uniref:fibronectin type III domain-containing protein n=1 Tax=Iocasia fonsfrigidae TaxID=2682810 RepID=UPI001E2DC428|nr:fibronectin type III domain-containing protein [Iocasia fonsfrigidae]
MYWRKSLLIICFFLIALFLVNLLTMAAEEIDNTTTVYELWQEMNEEESELKTAVLSEKQETAGEEIIEERGRYTKTFQQLGRKEMILYTEPVHYQDSQGNWQPIDTTIKKESSVKNMSKALAISNENSAYEDAIYDNDFKMKFARKLEQGIELSQGDYSLKIKLPGASSKYNEVKGSMKKYVEVWDNVDIQYNAFYDMLKESIILKNKEARNTFDFQLEMNTELSLKETEEGLILSDPATGDEIFELGRLFVFDKNTVEADYEHVDWQYQQQGKVINLQVVVDKEWLESSERSFPVVLDPWIKKISVSGSTKRRYWNFKEDKDQIIKWQAMIDTKSTGHRHSTKEHGIFYIKDLTTNSNLIYVKKGYKNDWSGSGYLSIKGNHNYQLFVQRYRLKAKRPGNPYYKRGTTWAKITFYDEPTLNPVTPKLLDQKGNTKYYPSLSKLNWTYSDPQGFAQQKVNIVVQKKGDSGVWANFLTTNDLNYSAQNYPVNNEQFTTDEYRWRIKGYNSKIWSDYSYWSNFMVDKLPPWPANGFGFAASLNLTKASKEETIRDAYSQGKKLAYTLEWNKFVDTDENQPVGSGLKEQILQYKQDGKGWQELSRPGPGQAATNFIVDWNSNYKFRIKAEDHVGNTSVWYPGSSNYAEFSTPSKPTRFKEIQFIDNKIKVEFYCHKLANAYQIKWKNTADDSIKGQTEWIKIPADYTGETYTYTIAPREIGFKYNQDYEISIATCNTENDELIVYNDPTSFQVANQPPLTPELKSPAADSYLTTTNLKLCGEKTSDPDGQQISYIFIVESLTSNQASELEWVKYGEYAGTVSEKGVETPVVLKDGHYRWKLRATDGLVDSDSVYRELYIDTTAPKTPVFQLQTTTGETISSTKQSQLLIYLEDYSRDYEQYPYPADQERINDLAIFKISSNLDQTMTVNKSELVNDQFIYQLEEVNGEHQLTVTSVDRAGNKASSTKSIIYDDQKPAKITFTEETSSYLSNSINQETGMVRVEFNWPPAVDKPVTVKNSGIASYLVELKRVAAGTTDLYETTVPSIIIDQLDFNEELSLRVKAIDGAGNQGPWSETVSWFTAAEPTALELDSISIEEQSAGLYQKMARLLIAQGDFQYYKIHRLNLSNTAEEELITPAIYDSLVYSQQVAPHQHYQYFIKTYNDNEHSTDGRVYGMTTELTVPNSLPTVPVIVVSGVNENGYLNTDTATININSTDLFGHSFSYCVDYDNDDLSYHFLVEEDGQPLIDKSTTVPSLALSNLKEGSTYQIQVGVTDKVKNQHGEFEYVAADNYSFTVDTESPVITMSEAAADYVAEQVIKIQAVDKLSQLKSITYKWGETGQLQAVPENGQLQALHGENKLIVIAVDKAGNQSSSSRVYRVDTTAPKIKAVHLEDSQQYQGNYFVTNDQEIYLSLEFAEDLTNIKAYYYGLIDESQSLSSITRDDLTKVEVNGIKGYTGEQLVQADLSVDHKYYPVMIVTNSVGRSTAIQKIEPGFYVDNSSPEIKFSVEGLVNNQKGRFLTEPGGLKISQEISDQESGIREIYYGISSQLHGETSWFASLEELKKGTNFQEGKTYYLAVKAVNNLGLVNSSYSEGFLVDTEKPEFIKLILGEELPAGLNSYIQRRNDYLPVSWLVNDISRISKYYYQLGTASGQGDISRNFPGADPEGWLEYDSTAYQASFRISSPADTYPDGIYYLTVKAVDVAGNERVSTTEGMEINTQLAPVPTIRTDGSYLPSKDYLHFIIEMVNPAQEISAYYYWIEDTSGKTVLDRKKVKTTAEIIDVDENEVSFQDGQAYYIYAQVQYLDGSSSESGFARVNIDSTAPELLSISVPDYASKEELSISWVAEEDYSQLSYQVKLGSQINSGDILDWVDIGTRQEAVFDNLDLTDGQFVYATIKAVNSSGLSAVKASQAIVIDNTSPPVPVVIDGGLYSIDDQQLSLDWRWTRPDPESGIRNYQVALLSSRNINADTAWVNVGAEQTNYTFKQQLRNGQKYYMAVKAINGAGLSSMELTDGIVIDVTKPAPPRIDDHGDYTDSLTTLEGTFNGSLDPESGIASFYYSLGTYSLPAKLVKEEEVGSTVISRNDLSLQVGEVYFFKAMAKNQAGLLSARTSSNGIMVVEPDRPKVSKIEDGGDFTINNDSLSFVWELDDPTVPFESYQYALVDSKDAEIANWSSTRKNQLTLKAEDLYGEGGLFEDGKTYYLAVRAVNMLGTPTTVKISDGITVDATPPTPAVLGVDRYTNNSFSLQWSCTDPDTKITGYQYAIGSSRGGTEITEGWRAIDLSHLNQGESSERIDRSINLALQHEGRYYLTVKAVNETGLWSQEASSSVIIADLEKPSLPLVTTESNSIPSYVNKKDLIENIAFSTEDSLSGIAAYRYQVVSRQDISGGLSGEIKYTDDFLKLYQNDDLDIDGLELVEGQTYYVAIQSVDRTGNWSGIGYSQPIIVDTIKPVLKFKTELAELVSNDGYMEIEWSTNEGGTIYYRTVPLDENGLPLNEPAFSSQVVVNYNDSFDFQESTYGRYEFQLYQVDLAGNATGLIKQLVRYNQPPVVSISGDSTNYKGHSIKFTGQVTDDTGPAKYSWRIGDYQVEKVVGVDEKPAEFSYQFLEIGTYQLELEVADHDGAATKESWEIIITNTLEGPLVLDETWSGEMQMRGTVVVPEGISLTIEPGTLISFPDSAYLIIKGEFEASGTVNMPITISGTYWSGLLIRQTAQVTELNYLLLSEAERGLTLEKQDITLKDCSLLDNKIGIHLHGSSPEINNCKISGNEVYGVKEELASKPVLVDCIFNKNGNDYYHYLLTNISLDKLNSLAGNSGNLSQEEGDDER